MIATKVTGTVNWFSVKSGYGFINGDDTKADVFVHQATIVKNNPRKYLRCVGDGEKVEFAVVEGKKGNEAAQITGPEGNAAQGSKYAASRRHCRPWHPRRRGGGPRRPPSQTPWWWSSSSIIPDAVVVVPVVHHPRRRGGGPRRPPSQIKEGGQSSDESSGEGGQGSQRGGNQYNRGGPPRRRPYWRRYYSGPLYNHQDGDGKEQPNAEEVGQISDQRSQRRGPQRFCRRFYRSRHSDNKPQVVMRMDHPYNRATRSDISVSSTSSCSQTQPRMWR